MKRRSKVLATALCAVLLVVASVMGTLAYLTDSESVTNTFTVGKVYIDMTEAVVNGEGKPLDAQGNVVTDLEDAARNVDAETGKPLGNAYHLLPNLSYTKDPTVTVKADSEDAYVRMKVTVTFADTLPTEMMNYDLSKVFDYNADWERVSYTVTDGKSIEYIYNYKNIVERNESQDTTLPALFTKITVPSDFTNEQMAVFGGMTIAVDAYAIQAEGFNSAAEAWAAFPTT